MGKVSTSWLGGHLQLPFTIFTFLSLRVWKPGNWAAFRFLGCSSRDDIAGGIINCSKAWEGLDAGKDGADVVTDIQCFVIRNFETCTALTDMSGLSLAHL